MFKSKIGERVQEVILPDFPDDENTVPTVTKSRRVSFGTNFVKEFIVGSAVSGQCLPEYEQAFPSSDSSNADSSHSAAEIGVLEHSMFVPPHDTHKIHKPVSQPVEPDFVESRPKLPKFSSTVCFSADSPTADMEFTEGCITLAKSILDKKNKEMTVIIQAKPKEPKDEEKPKEEETKYFDGSQFEISLTRCLKSKGNKREERRFECENTKIFSKYENEMSITRCNRIFTEDDTESSWEDCKENRMPLDMIMRHLDKENSDLENDLFNPEKNFDNFLKADASDLSNDSEKLNLNESMDISTDFQVRVPRNPSPNAAEFPMRKSTNFDVGGGKSLADVQTDHGIDKSADDLSLGESEPFGMVQSPPKTDCKMNKSVLHESKVLAPDAEQSHQLPPQEGDDDRMDRSTQQLSLDRSVEPSSEKVMMESMVTDHKISASTESQEVVTCEKEPMVLELPCTDKISESEESSRVEQSANHNELNTPTKRMSLDGTPEKGATEEPVVDDANKSPERMSLDGSNEVLPSEMVESPANTPSDHDHKLNKSSDRGSLDEAEDILRQESLMELTSTDKTGESTEPKKVDIQSADEISVSVEPEMVDFPSADQISMSAEPKVVDMPSADQISVPVESKMVDMTSADEISLPLEPKMVDMPSAGQISVSTDSNVVDMPSVDQISVSVEPEMVDLPPPDKITKSTEQIVADHRPAETETSPSHLTLPDNGKSTDSLDETDREPSPVDLRVIESLKEQSKEAGCLWCLRDVRHPQRKTQGWLSFNCKLLESTIGIRFKSKMTNEDSPVACSIVTNSEINLMEESQLRLPEYRLVVDVGFGELKKYFDKHQTQVETIRHVSYFLDQINSFAVKMNGCLRQILSILTKYPGSRLEGSRLSFRLFSFPIFFSSTLSIDLSDYFRLSKSSLSFETDLGSLDENKIGEIFEECLKLENSLCEFIVKSTKYLIDLEKESGRVSKRGHIRLLPGELKL